MLRIGIAGSPVEPTSASSGAMVSHSERVFRYVSVGLGHDDGATGTTERTGRSWGGGGDRPRTA